MNSYKHLKNVLNYYLDKSAQSCSLFCENPETDFTRERMLNFKTTMKNVICLETGSLNDELLKLNDFSIDTPTVSAFVQARSKIKVDAFKTLFDNFNKKTHVNKLWKGYRLIAIDGSELPIDNTVFVDSVDGIFKLPSINVILYSTKKAASACFSHCKLTH